MPAPRGEALLLFGATLKAAAGGSQTPQGLGLVPRSVWLLLFVANRAFGSTIS